MSRGSGHLLRRAVGRCGAALTGEGPRLPLGGVAWRAAVLGVVVVGATAAPGWTLAAAAGSQIGAEPTVQGTAVVAAVAAGRGFDGTHVSIMGNVDLRRLRVARAGLRCLDCQLQGSLLGTDVQFTDVVDLSGSTVTGRVDLRGATFAQELVWRDGTIDGTASASQAVFGNVVDAGGLVFARLADFTEAQFRAAASFAASDFYGPALFGGATFGADATFTAGTQRAGHPSPEPTGCPQALAGAFAAEADFTGATFAVAADFRGRCFHGPASFSDVIVHGPVSFDSALFLHGVVFDYATVAADLSFQAAQFASTVNLADLTGVTVGGDLRFDQAAIDGSLQLSHATVAGTLSFLLTQHGRDKTLQMSQLSTGGVVLDPSDIAWVAGPSAQIDMLQRVERTARANGDTDLANDARFAWLREAGDLHGTHDIPGVLDWLVYREIAGYLVRPFYPVRALAIVILAGILLNAVVTGHLWRWTRRMLRRARRLRSRRVTGPPRSAQEPITRPVPTRARRPRLRLRLKLTITAALRPLMRAVPLTLRAVLWRRLADPSLPAAARFLTTAESWAGKALLVVLLMCLANANPTLHQFIESLLSIGRNS